MSSASAVHRPAQRSRQRPGHPRPADAGGGEEVAVVEVVVVELLGAEGRGPAHHALPGGVVEEAPGRRRRAVGGTAQPRVQLGDRPLADRPGGVVGTGRLGDPAAAPSGRRPCRRSRCPRAAGSRPRGPRRRRPARAPRRARRDRGRTGPGSPPAAAPARWRPGCSSGPAGGVRRGSRPTDHVGAVEPLVRHGRQHGAPATRGAVLDPGPGLRAGEGVADGRPADGHGPARQLGQRRVPAGGEGQQGLAAAQRDHVARRGDRTAAAVARGRPRARTSCRPPGWPATGRPRARRARRAR